MAIFFKPKNPKKKEWYEKSGEFVESLVIALIMALMIKASVVEAYKIPSGSMEDTLLVGDFLLANKFVYGMKLPIPFVDIRLPAIEEPKPGDIVIFKYPRDPRVNYIKRCVAVEGQIVEIRDVIRKAGERKTVILSTHIMQEVEAICSRVLLIDRGRLLADGDFAGVRKAAAGGDDRSCWSFPVPTHRGFSIFRRRFFRRRSPTMRSPWTSWRSIPFGWWTAPARRSSRSGPSATIAGSPANDHCMPSVRGAPGVCCGFCAAGLSGNSRA